MLEISGKYIGAEAPVFRELVEEIVHCKKLASVVHIKKESEARANQNGYLFYVQKHSNESMVKFIEDVAVETGYKITGPGGVVGAAPFYSGWIALQDFSRLQGGLEATSQKSDGWVAKDKKAKKKVSNKKADVLMEKVKEKVDAEQQGNAKVEGKAEASAKKEEASPAKEKKNEKKKNEKKNEEKNEKKNEEKKEEEAAPAKKE